MVAMSGPDRHLNGWTAPCIKFAAVCKITNESSESLAERLVDYKIYALSVLCFMVP